MTTQDSLFDLLSDAPPTGPVRVQVVKRDGGILIPRGAVYVGRWMPGFPKRTDMVGAYTNSVMTEFGNPHVLGRRCPVPSCAGAKHTLAEAIEGYRAHLRARPDLVTAARGLLAGRDLACWCEPGLDCHADVLLAVARGEQP